MIYIFIFLNIKYQIYLLSQLDHHSFLFFFNGLIILIISYFAIVDIRDSYFKEIIAIIVIKHLSKKEKGMMKIVKIMPLIINILHDNKALRIIWGFYLRFEFSFI